MKFDSLIYQYFRQIKNVGTAITVIRGTSIVEPESGRMVPGQDERHESEGVLTTINQEYWPRGTITTGRLQVLLSAYQFTMESPEFIPAIDDMVQVDDKVYGIQEIKPIAPAGKALAYRLLVSV